MNAAGSLYVEIDIFSGRPNPGFIVPPEEAIRIMERLCPTCPSTPPPPRLGFRGFILHRAGGREKLRPWCRVGQGVIELLSGPQRGAYRDAFGTEQLIMEQARQFGFANVLGQFPT